MRESLLVYDNQAFQQLPGDGLRLTLGSLHLHVNAEVAIADVFHRNVNVILTLIPLE